MAVRAGNRRWLVKQDELAVNFALQGVALPAGHILVPTSQREFCSLIVIKGRWLPGLRDMAVRASGHAILGRKLASVRIGMAGIAILSSSLELNLVRARKSLVTFAAGDNAMRSHQIEFRLGVVEPMNINPGAHVVAGFASQGRSVRPACGHPIVELSFVRIGVACRAGAVFKMERQNFVLASPQADLVAFRASDGGMRAGQGEARLHVLGNRIRGAVEVLHRVAVFATILIRRRGELVVMRVLMAIRACREFHFINRVLAGRRMALVAGDRGVLALQRVAGRGVLFHSK